MTEVTTDFWLRVLNARLSLDRARALLDNGLETGGTESALQAAGLTHRQAAAFLDTERLERAQKWLAQSDAHWLLHWEDSDYPERLRTIHDPPPVLMGQGHRALLQDPQVAVVGARHATREGLNNARQFARALSAAGLTVTSGLAHGIDAAAHEGALEGPGNTVAVVGTGVDRVYPAAHRALAHRIVEQGVMISPFPLGTPPKAAHFPLRNRIVSGLSLGVLVVEAADRSGSLITARLAMEQGREVFAIPGSIHNPMARGCHRLIRQGARLVESADEILEELAPQLQAALFEHDPVEKMQASMSSTSRVGDEPALSEEAQQVWAVLDFAPVSLDVLAQSVSLPLPTVQSILLELELAGRVEKLPGGFYKRMS